MTTAQRWMAWLTGLAIFVALIYLLRHMLLPFVAGMAIAYLLDPTADRLERAGMSRILATSMITLFFFVVTAVALVLLIPLISDQITDFIHRVPDYADALAKRTEPLVHDIMRRLSPNQIERLQTAAGDYAGTVASWAVGVAKGVLSGGLAVVNLLSLLFITPVVTFYLLRDWDRLVQTINSWLPRDNAETIRAQMREINRTLSGFVRGQAMVCLFLGAFYAIGLSLVGIDLGLLIGLFSGLLSFVPYLGTISGLVVSMAVGFAQSPDWVLPALAAAVYVVGNIIEGYFLTPKLVGGKIGLHPVWVMFALLAGATLFGFLGLLIAVPVAAVVGVLVRFGLRRYLESPLHKGSSGL